MFCDFMSCQLMSFHIIYFVTWCHIMSSSCGFRGGPKFSQFHAVFRKIWQNQMLAPNPPLEGWRPLLRESWIRPCLRCHVLWCHVLLWYLVLWYIVIPFDVRSYDFKKCCDNTPCLVASSHFIWQHVLSYRKMSFHKIVCDKISYHGMWCFEMTGFEIAYYKMSRWTVPKYRSTSVYTSTYISHHTVQCESAFRQVLQQSTDQQ